MGTDFVPWDNFSLNGFNIYWGPLPKSVFIVGGSNVVISIITFTFIIERRTFYFPLFLSLFLEVYYGFMEAYLFRALYPSQSLLFLMLTLVSKASGIPFKLLWVFLTWLCWSLRAYLLFHVIRCPWLILYISCPRPKISWFS